MSLRVPFVFPSDSGRRPLRKELLHARVLTISRDNPRIRDYLSETLNFEPSLVTMAYNI